MTAAATALEALGDPTRRAILDALRSGPRPVGEIAAGLPVSRPAVSKHLRTLRAAGLVTTTPRGTKTLCALDPAGFLSARDWLDTFWDVALRRFQLVAENLGDHP